MSKKGVNTMKEYAKGFYTSTAWKSTRAAYIKSVNGLCERCKAAGQFVPGRLVHHKKHITPRNINDPKVTLSFSNLELLCDDCHNKEHKRKDNARYTFAPDGTLLPPGSRTPPGGDNLGQTEKNRGRYIKKALQGSHT